MQSDRAGVCVDPCRELWGAACYAMRRDRLDIGELRLEPAGVRDRPARQAQRRRRVRCLGVARVRAAQDA